MEENIYNKQQAPMAETIYESLCLSYLMHLCFVCLQIVQYPIQTIRHSFSFFDVISFYLYFLFLVYSLDLLFMLRSVKIPSYSRFFIYINRIRRKNKRSFFFNRMTDQNIINLRSADPFADVTGLSTSDTGASGGAGGQRSSNVIHIRIQQRSGKKTLTTVQGIGEEFDKKRLLRAFKKKFACNGTVVEHQEYGEVIQLQGDQRTHVSQFLKEIGICQAEQLKVHGF